MHLIRFGFWAGIILMIGSCITSYDPEIKAVDEKKFVVDGQVLAGDNVCKVKVSMTSPNDKPQFLPVSDCTIELVDSAGHRFKLKELAPGDYQRDIDPEFIIAGMTYWIEVNAPSGEFLKSDGDVMTTGPAVDQVYYEIEKHPGSVLGLQFPGIQFYLDLKASESNSRYYRWEAFETWEYHTDYPLEWYYDGMIHHVFPPDYSLNVCWRTLRVPSVFDLSTANLVMNQFEGFPLHFVDTASARLQYGYSLLIRQYSLSESAYVYYDQLRANNEQEGGLYEKQPLAVKGNMHNVDSPGDDVLGFFSASTVTSKRIFVYPIPELTLNFFNFCSPYRLIIPLSHINPSLYPIYIMGNQFGYTNMLLDGECVDCRLLGGVTVKPLFWPF